MSDLAPVAIFAFRRSEILAGLLDSLRQCPEASRTDVHIFCDGATDGIADEVAATRNVALSARGFRSVSVSIAETNRGLAASVIAGVSEICDKYGCAIVLEDDLEVSVGFLTYMNKGLTQFRNDEKVGAIAAHSFITTNSDQRAFFLHGANSWGWATWQRAWQNFEQDPDVTDLFEGRTRNRFDLNNSYPYTYMLIRQRLGQVDSWAIRWWWTLFVRQQLSLFPPASLVRNVGFGIGATNTKSSRNTPAASRVWSALTVAPEMPSNIEVDDELSDQWERAIRVGTLKKRIINARVSWLIRRLH